MRRSMRIELAHARKKPFVFCEIEAGGLRMTKCGRVSRRQQ
jgi:hypothetical protein